MGIRNIHLLSEVDVTKVGPVRPLSAAELSDIRRDHESGLHDTNKMICCPQCLGHEET